jgi:hypothetical protein
LEQRTEAVGRDRPVEQTEQPEHREGALSFDLRVPFIRIEKFPDPYSETPG